MAQKDSDGAELTGSEKYVVKGVTYTVHPAAALFPLVAGEEYEEGVASVRAQGILNPVRHLGREIVDGRNRLRWGLEAGVDIPMEALDPEIDVYKFVAAQNLNRRHLKVGPRATIAEGLVRLSQQRRRANYEAREAARQARRHGNDAASEAAGGNGGPPEAGGDAAPAAAGDAAMDASTAAPEPAEAIKTKEAAQMLGVSDTSVKRVEHIVKRAPELRPYLRDDRLSIAQATQLSRATPEQRKRVIDAVERGDCEDFAEAITRHAVSPTPTRGKQPAGAAAAGAKPTAKSAGPKPDASGSGLPALPSLGGAPLPSPSGAAAASGGGDAPADAAAASGGGDAPPEPAAGEPEPADAIPAPPAAPEGDGQNAAAARPAPSAAVAPVSAAPQYAPVAPAQAALAEYPPDLLSPEPVVTAVREIYGTIQFDPCSTDEGQDRVRAKAWYGADQDGLTERWQGPVHVFPPGKMCRQFAAKLRAELDRDLEQASFLANFDLNERWVGDFLDHRHFSAVVISRKLVEFDQAGQPRRYRPPQLAAVFLFGANATPEQLARAFGFWGRVLVNVRER